MYAREDCPDHKIPMNRSFSGWDNCLRLLELEPSQADCPSPPRELAPVIRTGTPRSARNFLVSGIVY